MKFVRDACCLAAAMVAAVAHGQSTLELPVGQSVGYLLDSGALANRESTERVVYAKRLHVAGAAWMRVYFDVADLPGSSFIVVRSALDGETHMLDRAGMERWSKSTAFLNGDTVEIELHAAAGADGARVKIERLLVEQGQVAQLGAPGECGICNSDDRVPSSEAWTGRLLPIGCTASIFCEDGTVTSAGHCAVGNDLVLEFNVPPSTSGCALMHPPVADQYPIVSQLFLNGGVGADWSVMRPGVNSAGQTCFERQRQLRRYSTTVAAVGQPANVYGYGADATCIRTQTQQLSTGSIVIRDPTTYRFNNDVRGGNSGSGLVVNGFLVGVVAQCVSTCQNIATRGDLGSFVTARNTLGLCDNFFPLLVQSIGATSVPVDVSPVDAGGLGPGFTEFTRTYRYFTTVTLTAPLAFEGACFSNWMVNGVPTPPGAVLTVNMLESTSAVAVYVRNGCCQCDWNRDGGLSDQDVQDFLTSFFQDAADFNANGRTDSQDFFDFLSCFYRGCP